MEMRYRTRSRSQSRRRCRNRDRDRYGSEKRDVGKELFSLYERECCRVRFISIIISCILNTPAPPGRKINTLPAYRSTWSIQITVL